MYAQIIDDTVGNTLCAASTLEKDVKAELGEDQQCRRSSTSWYSNRQEGTGKRHHRRLSLTEAASYIRVKLRHWQTQHEKLD